MFNEVEWIKFTLCLNRFQRQMFYEAERAKRKYFMSCNLHEEYVCKTKYELAKM
jgi:hypothetical protein